MTNLLRALVLCAVAAGCRAPSSDAPADGGAVVSDAQLVALTGRQSLRESSGVAMSRTQPGMIYMIDDSGNRPALYAFDTTGADRGSWRITNATNRDWEALAIAPCDSASCVYIGDVGDNKGIAQTRRIYRVTEPRPDADSARAEFLEYTYVDGAHDVEAMYVTSAADIFLITKRPLARGGNRLRPALVYSLPATAWKNGAARAAHS